MRNVVINAGIIIASQMGNLTSAQAYLDVIWISTCMQLSSLVDDSLLKKKAHSRLDSAHFAQNERTQVDE